MTILLLVVAMSSVGALAQPASPRLEINLAAGVPQYVGNSATTSTAPQSQWWYENTANETTYSSPSLWRARTPRRNVFMYVTNPVHISGEQLFESGEVGQPASA
jgi:hypothetical protein